MKLKSFCEAKDMVNKKQWLPTKWEKMFTNSTSDRGLISKIFKELKKLVIKRTKNPILKMGTDLNRKLSTEEFSIAEKHLRKCSTSLLIREIKSKQL